nr:TonB dependent receptor [uncultured organism]
MIFEGDRRFPVVIRLSEASRSDLTEVAQGPIRDISVRGSYGRSVRAPNIGEIFRPQTGTSNFFSDPCYLGSRGNGTATRAANCQTLITGLGGNPATFTANNNPNATIFIPGTVQGNPDLRAEVARTWTAGVVLRPRIVRNLSIAVDWYDIRLKDAINQPDANVISELCVDQPTLDNVYCRAISRQQGTGFINGFVVQPQNVDAFRTVGLEVNATYRIDTASVGRFDLRLVGGYLHALEQVATPGASVENNVDALFRPRFNAGFAPTWSLDALTVSYNLRWQNGVRRYSRFDTVDNPSLVDPRISDTRRCGSTISRRRCRPVSGSRSTGASTISPIRSRISVSRPTCRSLRSAGICTWEPR